MQENIKQHLITYNIVSGWDVHENDPKLLKEELLETLFECGEELSREIQDKCRWWNEVLVIKKFTIDEIKDRYMIIGYIDAETTRDESATDCGWEFDESTIQEYKAKTETIVHTSYEPISSQTA